MKQYCKRCQALGPLNHMPALCDACYTATQNAYLRLQNFTPEEFGKDYALVDVKLLYLLQALRTMVAEPFIIHCAYERTGHAPNSYHYSGQAVDFHVKSREFCFHSLQEEAYHYWKLIHPWWSGGFGAYPYWEHPGFHLDIGPKRRWWQNEDGKYINTIEDQ